MLIKKTLRIVAYEKLSYLCGIMVSHASSRTAVRQVNCELSWLNYHSCFNFHNVTFSREIQGYHTAEERGEVSLDFGSAFHLSFLMPHLTHWSLQN